MNDQNRADPDLLPFAGQFEQQLSRLRASDPEAAARMARQKYRIFYTDPRTTLQPGPLYFCGLKPYGQSGATYPIIAPTARPEGFAAYLDEPIARSSFARRAVRLLTAVQTALGVPPDARSVFCTNWFFYRAPDLKALTGYGLAHIDCSAYHRDFLARVQPRVVLCVGNGQVSAFAGMCALHGVSAAAVQQLPVARSARLKWAHGTLPDGSERLLIGLPHLSRYDLDMTLPGGERLLNAVTNLLR